MQYHLAIDIGASQGRHILGHVEDGRMVLEEVYRFENRQVRRRGHDCWNLEALWENILAGMRACYRLGKIPSTLGIDTWAVDFVLLDRDGGLIGDAVAYRDKRTQGMREQLEEDVPFDWLYSRTGIQHQPFNTIYQLAALTQERPEELDRAAHFLMLPEYFNYLLTGVIRNEYTNATSTALVNAKTRTWDEEVLIRMGLPFDLFGPLSMPGTILGGLKESVQARVGYNCQVILPATHDTGSAFLAVPARDDEAVFLSSDTWSLLGVELHKAITTPESQAENFTNEGGAWRRFRFLKNIMGLWMVECIYRELNGISYVEGERRNRTAGTDQNLWTFEALAEAAREAADFPSTVDVNDHSFLAPESMFQAIRDFCEKTGQQPPETVGETMQCIYHSLALCYADAVDCLSRLTGKRFTSINIVGGGSQDAYLNEMTARATGLTVYAGPVEGVAIGNLLVQMMVTGDYSSLWEARNAIGESFDIQEIVP